MSWVSGTGYLFLSRIFYVRIYVHVHVSEVLYLICNACAFMTPLNNNSLYKIYKKNTCRDAMSSNLKQSNQLTTISNLFIPFRSVPQSTNLSEELVFYGTERNKGIWPQDACDSNFLYMSWAFGHLFLPRICIVRIYVPVHKSVVLYLICMCFHDTVKYNIFLYN